MKEIKEKMKKKHNVTLWCLDGVDETHKNCLNYILHIIINKSGDECRMKIKFYTIQKE